MLHNLLSISPHHASGNSVAVLALSYSLLRTGNVMMKPLIVISSFVHQSKMMNIILFHLNIFQHFLVQRRHHVCVLRAVDKVDVFSRPIQPLAGVVSVVV